MKRIALLSIFLLFFIRFEAFAQYDEVTDEQEASNAAEFVLDSRVQYELPYPGILPDHPLYFLKAMRDRLVSFLINDTQKRAEFNLLTADKRMYASVFLVQKDKDGLAVSTISKGNNYFEEAVSQVILLKKSSKPTSDITHRLLTASQKHEELLEELKSEVDSEYEEQFAREEDRVKKHITELEKLLNQKKP
jgi:hypothetical protein